MTAATGGEPGNELLKGPSAPSSAGHLPAGRPVSAVSQPPMQTDAGCLCTRSSKSEYPAAWLLWSPTRNMPNGGPAAVQ